MVPNVALITMKAGIRTLSGIKFLTIEIATLEQISTNRVESPIPKPPMAEVVVPKVGHMPNRRTKVGFSFIIPLKSIFVLLMIASFHGFGISRIGGLYGRQKSSRCNCRGCDGIYVA